MDEKFTERVALHGARIVDLSGVVQQNHDSFSEALDAVTERADPAVTLVYRTPTTRQLSTPAKINGKPKSKIRAGSHFFAHTH